MRWSERLRLYEKLGQEEILVSRHLIAFAIYDISSRCVFYVPKKVEHHGLGRSVKPFCHKTAKEPFLQIPFSPSSEANDGTLAWQRVGTTN